MMQRYQILHRTYYNFTSSVRLGPHTLLLRPREGHELRIESAVLETTPPATIRWHRDVEDNSVAIATFSEPCQQLQIESRSIVQQYNQAPLDFVVADYATHYPFAYRPEEAPVLSPYRRGTAQPVGEGDALERWVAKVWQAGERIQTYALLQRLALHVQETFVYGRREEPGVQAPTTTLARGAGSCRDFAFLFIEAARGLGLAARFVSGYLNSPPSTLDLGATHAWAEVFLPGAGWKGFDPTLGKIVGADHIAVAVARSPESVPPVAGTFVGAADSSLDVGVWVTPLAAN
jgi:transglutaminase-like putative cysteine protease